ncbi:MAG: AAA family ATPase [Saprospiraceae bacterium]|nr:AAA family ATPase [Saprospiraceae bacterium]
MNIYDELYDSPEFRKYKFRELKVYASTEWLADNKKKYRQVFDRYESAYMYAELSLYNKMFDLDDWDVEVELKCFSLKKGKTELCSLPFRRKVSKYDNIIYVREGWGNKKEGAFWKKGTYYWEVYVDGEKVATKYFYIEDGGREVTFDDNPYLELQSLRLYEGPYDDILEAERVYCRKLHGEETRYIYAEITFKNLNTTRSWQCELFTKFYNNARELKGQIVRLHRVERKEEYIVVTAGWGSNVKGSWRNDHYTCEIVFMDKLLAVLPFEVGDEFEEGSQSLIKPNQTLLHEQSKDDDSDVSFEDVMSKLEALIGLSQIKQKVRDHAKYLQFLQIRKDNGFEEDSQINVHSVFVGNPGTGKTTVAKMMGKLYKKMGLLSKGHVHEVDRVDLVGEYIGQTAPKVKDAIEKARGGVLFIDEAYSLARSLDDTKDFGREVIEILVKEMSNGAGDLAVIVAGYPKEMKQFIDANPGLRSRFKHFLEFQDYLPQELSQIADYAAHEKGIVLSPNAKKRVDEIITEAYRNRDRTFGNARFAYDVLDQAKINMGLRLMTMDNPRALSKDELSLVSAQDVDKIQLKTKRALPNIPIDEQLLKQSLDELSRLIGMTKIKTQINELVDLVRYYRESGRDVLGNFYLHTVFVGNPGTGKTTVARILTKIYKSLGILERGHMVETDRQGLVAGYVGQTAIKTAEKINESIGGVLFIDEAYALTSYGGGGRGDFGDEAIQTLLKRMEDNRGEFFVFVAGYTDNMETFLKANPGLSSRFDKKFMFDDYQPEELMEIAVSMLHDGSVTIAADAEEHLRNYLSFIHEYRDKYFGNARTIRQIVTDIINKHNLRLAAMPKEERNERELNVISMQDVEHLKLDKSDFTFAKKGIGFKSREGNR